MKKAKIAFVIPTLGSGGAERVVSTLSNILCKSFEVHIICLIKTKPFYNIDDEVKIHYCIAANNDSHNFATAILNNVNLIRKINATIKKNNIDILLGFLTSANVLSIIASKLQNIPVIISERNNPKNDFVPRMWKKLRDLFFPIADLIIVQTESTKSFYQKKINGNKIVIIPNPISTDFTPETVTFSSHNSKKNIILNVGRLHPQKAQDVLITAFSNSQNKNWKLYLVGEGESRNDLETLIFKLNLQEKVKLLGSVEEIQNVYNEAKIFAFSSIFEGFPNALVEAMHFGLPCVSTNCPTGPSELIDDGENGFLINVNDAKSLTDKLNILMESRELRISFGQKAQKTVSKFNAENIAKEWTHHINSCLNIK